MYYTFWYDVAEYGSENWKGNFTPREIALYAYEYQCCWDNTLDNKVLSPLLRELMNELREDGTDKATEFLEEIKYNLKLFNIPLKGM